MGAMRKAIEDYHMIENGGRIAVGVSGGKDSVSLLIGLAGLRRFIGIDYEVVAVCLDPQFGGEPNDFSEIEALCEKIGVKLDLRRTHIGDVIFEDRKEKNPCSLCARMRRGLLHDVAKENGCNKMALGHNFEDAVETFVMNLLFEGRIGCFQPVTNLDRTGIIQIRPMLYIHERTVDNFSKRMELPIIENRCPVDKETKRTEVKELVYNLSQTYPDLKERIFGAMQRYPLAEWEPHGRYKRPKEQ
jgi:tRNA(Ile)-lysidine synthase TilS/MesJ